MTRKNLALLLAIISLICLGFIAQANFFITKIDVIEREKTNLSAENTELSVSITKKEQQIQELEERNRALEEELQTKIVYFEEEEILAKLLWCEAGNQSWEGQVYTCSAILNYCERNNTSIWDSAHNINAFEPAPYVDDAEPTAMQYEVIYYVLNGGRIPDICWFRTGQYHNFGTPVAKVGDHYFSKP